MLNDKNTLQQALTTIQKLKRLLQERQQAVEPIALVGLSCRFPQAANKEAFWQLLSQGRNAITELPASRWELLKDSDEYALRKKNYAYWGSYLSDIELFDAYAFGISPREAVRMDPQQRLMLEVAYEAIDDAGCAVQSLAGTQMGVFASLYASQFGHMQQIEDAQDALYLPTGNAISMAANRLSYLLDLKGPSTVIDTACSSSLVAIHLACLSLQTKRCDTALVCAANINLSPSINYLLSQANMLSPDGQCKTFDAGANGYVQGEGVGAIILKPLSKALQDHDRIYAVIQGSAVNQDGKTNGLTAPNGRSQETVLQSAYQAARVQPAEIAYVECHGTGTFLGDPIEIQALGEVVSRERHPDKPCWIGSVKTNIGHLEPAAGIASVIKVALSLKNKIIPPHLNFVTPNPHIHFSKYHFKIPQQNEAWPQYSEHRFAGVSGFGFGGTNAHLVLRDCSTEESSHAHELKQYLKPWQRKKYWPVFTHHSQEALNEAFFGGKQLHSPLNHLQFEFTFDTQAIPEIKDTHHILHAGYYCEMLAYIAEALTQHTQFVIHKMSFSSPIVVPEKAQVKVQVVLEKNADGFDFTFYSSTHQGTAWKTHTKGTVSFQLQPTHHTISIPLFQKSREAKPASSFYERIKAMGMPSEKSIAWTKQYWLGQNEILCEFAEPTALSTHDFKLKIHFGVVDACIQALFLMLPASVMNPYVASSIEEFKFLGGAYQSLYLYATLDHIEPDGKKFTGHWYLLNEAGQVIAVCSTVTMSQLGLQTQINQIAAESSEAVDLADFPEYLLTKVAALLSMPKEDINIHQPLTAMGLDSLMALVLIRTIESVGVNYPLEKILQGPSINDIVQTVLNQSQPTLKKNPWIVHRTKHANSKLRLFCFPFGGAGASVYRDWQNALPQTIEVCPIQLPGREERMNEASIHYIESLLNQLVDVLRDEMNQPFAFFGHSFGSLVGFELARLLRKRNLPQPHHIFISAFPDPRQPSTSLNHLLEQLKSCQLNLFELNSGAALAALSPSQLTALLSIFNENGIMEYSQATMTPDIIKILLPIFIGDMSIVRSYRYQDEPALTVPMSVFLGERDAWVPPSDVLGWSDHTTQLCAFHAFDSGHLFIRDKKQINQVLKLIAQAVG